MLLSLLWSLLSWSQPGWYIYIYWLNHTRLLNMTPRLANHRRPTNIPHTDIAPQHQSRMPQDTQCQQQSSTRRSHKFDDRFNWTRILCQSYYMSLSHTSMTYLPTNTECLSHYHNSYHISAPFAVDQTAWRMSYHILNHQFPNIAPVVESKRSAEIKWPTRCTLQFQCT